VNLILFERREVSDDGAVSVSDVRATHLLHVLRVVVGQSVRVGVVDGPLGVAVVHTTRPGAVELRCTFAATVPPPPPVDLLLALPRPKVMRRLWAQVAALGVGQIILTNAERVERNYFDTHVLTPECYRPLLIEGLQQVRDTHVPRVSIHRQLKVLLEDQIDELSGPGQRLIADPAATTTIGAAVRESGEARVLLAIGPEGGWSAFELGLFRAHRFRPVGMGERTLRTDTACVALLTLAHDAMWRR
jgi:RsmE family RNA methyltransferase